MGANSTAYVLRANNITTCGTWLDPITDSEIVCTSSIFGYAVRVRSDPKLLISKLGICSLGVLTKDCGNCKATSFSRAVINNKYYVDPVSLITNTTDIDGSFTSIFIRVGDPVGVTITVFDVQKLTDSISLVCSTDASTCGPKSLVIWDVDADAEKSFDSLYMVYNATKLQITFANAI